MRGHPWPSRIVRQRGIRTHRDLVAAFEGCDRRVRPHPPRVDLTRPARTVPVRAGLRFGLHFGPLRRAARDWPACGKRTTPRAGSFFGCTARQRCISMQRVTITIDDELMRELGRIIAVQGYQNRSEEIRDLARAGIREAAEGLDHQRDCVAALVYVYDHAARQLSKRLADTFHDHHELSLASMHAHLDHDSCMEVTILRGKSQKVRDFA